VDVNQQRSNHHLIFEFSFVFGAELLLCLKAVRLKCKAFTHHSQQFLGWNFVHPARPQAFDERKSYE
jgi:hypothetical protein